jgi:NAD(P)H-flavin reductase
MTLIYSNKTPEDIIYRKELEDIGPASGSIKVVLTVTRPEKGKWSGATGRINEGMIKENVSDIANAYFYICGPKEMINIMIDMLRGVGAAPGNIKTERWN